MCLVDNVPVQFGLASWGGGCGDANAAGVYVNLANYRDQIKQASQDLILKYGYYQICIKTAKNSLVN